MFRSQALFEQKQTYELELAHTRAKYEEEASHVKEDEAKIFEDVMEKQREQLESAHSTTEREKHQIINVSAHNISKQMFQWSETIIKK